MDGKFDMISDNIHHGFFSHLEENKIGYFSHLKRALSISRRMFICSIKTAFHGIFPSLWTTAATDTVNSLFNELH